MKNIRLILLCGGCVLTLCTIQAYALPLLPFPTADHLSSSAFIQPFAGFPVVSESGGIGRTAPFFSDLPDGSLPGNMVINILGNFQAFDPSGAPVPFTANNIVGVEVTDLGATFTPAFGEFDFAGHPSLTFMDPLDFDQVTLSAGDFTLAFTFTSDAALDYSYTLLTSGLPEGSFFFADDIEPPPIPEPGTLLLVGSGLAGLLGWRLRQRRHKIFCCVATAGGGERKAA